VGAANWGNSSKKEEFEVNPTFDQFQEKCWPGYEKKGMKTMFGKRYPNCVKKKATRKEETEIVVDEGMYDTVKTVMDKGSNFMKKNPVGKVLSNVVKPFKSTDGGSNRKSVTAADQKAKGLRVETHYGSSVNKIPGELDKAVEMHKSQAKRLRDSEEVKKDAGKAANAVPGQLDKAVALHTKQAKTLRKAGIKDSFSNWRDELQLSEDDMKGMSVKSGHKRPTDKGAGMTKKGVEAYRRRNPGSKLSTAVTTPPSKLKAGSKAAKRRKSYCARSAGQMKQFPKAAKDPNSRLRQARRRWNC
tara:strand:- start:462 stop:1364 length:903 start_codon:yes stop_codon:yes gene_type:complete